MKNPKIQRRFSYKTIVLVSLITGMTASAIAFGIGRHYQFRKKTISSGTSFQNQASISSVRNLRLKNYQLTKPLLMAELPDESAEFEALRRELSVAINMAESGQEVTSAAIYLHDFSNGHWMGINKSEQYDPGSILKLTILLAYLRKAQEQPGLLDRKILFARPFTTVPYQTIRGESIIPGRSYTVRELIKYMLVESDNQANALLNNSIEPDYALKVFSDLELQVPRWDAPTVNMNCVDVSRFLRLLFNSSYTQPELSEYALELLTAVRYENGIRTAFPPEVTIAHKFGERGFQNSPEKQLHETALVYLKDRVLLITIMTKGENFSAQEDLIRKLSGLIAGRFSSPT